MAMLDLHHIDFDQLEKGSVIDAVVVQAVIGVQRSDRAFSLGLLRLKGVIEDFFYSERGQRVVVRSHRDSLIVLDDPEQSRHSRHTFNAELCRLEEIHQDLLAVDTRNLNSEEHEAHTRAEVVQSKYLQAIGNVRAKLLPRPTERTVPGMVS